MTKTKKAIAIKGFVAELALLALDSMAIKTGLQGINPNISIKKAAEMLEQSQRSLMAFLVDIVETNPEQVEALMKELNFRWTTPSEDEQSFTE
jgi:hypothetical protein